MRKIFLAAVVAMTLAGGGTAFAQSQQGGYLGQNPGGQQIATTTPSGVPGSHQGGYLGLNAGGQQAPARTADADIRGTPENWCTSSPEPSRCRARAAAEHGLCMTKEPQHYASCRFALDQMHGN
jgi:hypothetical protein